MPIWRRFESWLSWFPWHRRKAREADLARELRDHLELEAEEQEAAGLSPEEARRAALLKFGNAALAREDTRAAWGFRWLESLLQDLSYGLRMLRKSPGFTAAAVLILAVGIGVNATVFSMVNSMLLRGIPVPHPSGLVSFGFSFKGSPVNPASYLDFQDVRQQAGGLVDLFAYLMQTDGLTAGNHTDRIVTNYVTGNYFAGLGIKPSLGRLILPSDVKPGGYDPIVVLSYSYWQSRLGANPSIIGKTIRVSGKPFTVVGVTQRGFQGPLRFVHVQAFLPLNVFGGAKELWAERGYKGLFVLGRLQPGVPLLRAKAAVEVIASRLAREHPNTDPEAKAWLLPGGDAATNPLPKPGDFRRMLVTYTFSLTLALLVLFIACFNLANLLLARATARQHEMTVRAALGAGRGRLLRQALAETLLLAGLACGVGILLGFWASRLLEAIRISNGNGPVSFNFAFDSHVFLYAAGAALLAVLMAGVAPAVRASRSNPCDALHEGGRGVIGGRNRIHKVLVVAQIAGSVVLLVMAGRGTRSLIAAEHTDLGFNASHLFKLEMSPSEAGYDQAQSKELYQNLLPRVRALPGVRTAALAYSYPSDASGGFIWEVQAEEHPIPPGQIGPTIGMTYVSPGYFKTMQIPILRGRPFLETDTANSPPVAVVNEKLARQLWPNENPLGERFSMSGPAGPWIDIVGVAADSTYTTVSSKPTPYFYLPASRNPAYAMLETLLVRTEVPSESMIGTVEAQVRAIAPDVPVWGAQTMRQTLDSSLGGFYSLRLGAVVAMTIGLLALALAVAGVYGVVSYDVGRRTHEMGIRIALGARPRNIQRIIFRQGLAMLGAGLFFGVLAALGLAVVISHVRPASSVRDPLLTYLAAAILISAATLFACWIPARRAMRVDPVTALRNE